MACYVVQDGVFRVSERANLALERMENIPERNAGVEVKIVMDIESFSSAYGSGGPKGYIRQFVDTPRTLSPQDDVLKHRARDFARLAPNTLTP